MVFAFISIGAGVILISVCIYLILISYEKSQQSPKQIVDILQKDKYSPDMGEIAANNQLNKSVARTGLLTTLGQEVRAGIDMETQQKELVEQQFDHDNALQKKKEERFIEQAVGNNTVTVINAANQEGLDPETYKQIRLKQAEAEIEIKKKELELKLEVSHKRELKRIELEAEKYMVDLDKELLELKTLLPYHEVNVLGSQLSGLSMQLDTIKLLPESDHKEREIKRITGQMKTWQKDVTARQKRLT